MGIMVLDAAALPDDPATLRAMLRAAHDEIERLRGFIAALNRNKFGARSEKLDPDQLSLGLEDAEQELAASAEAVERKAGPVARVGARRNLGNLPAHLPRIERVIDIDDKACPVLPGRAVPDRRGRSRAAGHRAGPVPRDRHPPPQIRVPGLRRHGAPGPGARARGRGRAADGSARRAGDHEQVRRSLPALSPGGDLRAPRHRSRPRHAGRLGRASGLAPCSRLRPITCRSDSLAEAVRRRDDGPRP
jgi:hypothetical protein